MLGGGWGWGGRGVDVVPSPMLLRRPSMEMHSLKYGKMKVEKQSMYKTNKEEKS